MRKGCILSVYAVQCGSAEVIETEVLETSPLVGSSFRDIDMPDGARIGKIYRDGVMIRSNGSTKIKAKDRVVLFASADTVREVEQLAGFRYNISSCSESTSGSILVLIRLFSPLRNRT